VFDFQTDLDQVVDGDEAMDDRGAIQA